MAKCPRCGAEVVDPVKSWSMIGKPDKSGEMFKLTIGLYNCVCSDKSFRSVIGKEKVTLKGVLEKNNSLEEQLMEATSKKSELEGMVKVLEEEKTQLFAEVEALKAIPMLEERMSSLESDIAKLREEKGALMSRLTKLVTDAPSAVQPVPVEKPLETYISEAMTIEAPTPIEEGTCECHVDETEEIETQIEAPMIDAVSTGVSVPVDLPVETLIEEKLADVPQVEAAPVSVAPEEALVNAEGMVESPSCDTLSSEEKTVETPVETAPTDVTLVEAPPIDEKPVVVEVVEPSPIDVVNVEVMQVEMPAMENPVVVEAASPDAVPVDVSSSEPQVVAPVIEEKPVDAPPIEAQVEVPVEAVPETTQAVSAPVETATEPADEVEEIPSEPLLAEPLVDVVPAEPTPVEVPTPMEEKLVEVSPPVLTPVDVPSIESVPPGENLTESITTVVSSVEILNEVTSAIAQEFKEETPVEAVVPESTPINAPEPVQVVPVEATQPEMPAQVQDKPAEAPVVEPLPVDAPKIESPVIETVSAETPKVEEILAETPVVEDKLIEAPITGTASSEVANVEAIVSEVKTAETPKPTEEKPTELHIV